MVLAFGKNERQEGKVWQGEKVPAENNGQARVPSSTSSQWLFNQWPQWISKYAMTGI
jgi:hypothetical protein